jgi:hypothetical protein
LLGFEQNELVVKSLSELIPQEEKAHSAKVLSRIYLGLGDQGKMNLVLSRKDNTRIAAEIS